MNEFDTRVFDLLDAYTPEPHRWPDWQDVLRRTRTRRTHRVLVAVAAVVVVLGSAAGVTAALGGFHSWLSGAPGKPAPKDELNNRSYAGFPKDTNLRELIRTKLAGKLYVLYGFRSGESLCLRLKAVTLGHSAGPACAPAAQLRHAPAPILPVIANDDFVDRHNHPTAATSFGIAADGLSRVVAHAVDGDHRAILGGNAYLWIQDEPNSGQRAYSLTAVALNGTRVTVALDREPTLRAPRGPTRIEARIAHPHIRWYEHSNAFGPTQFVKPDPKSNVRIGLVGRGCLVVAYGPREQSSGCSDSFWTQGPLDWMMTAEYGVDFMRISGVVADGVTRVVVFLADGERQQAFLRKNVFTMLAATTEFPARIVAYDSADRVVGIVTPSPFFFADGTPAAARKLRKVSTTHGPHGAVATGYVGRRVRDYRCWRVDFSTGQSRASCDKGVVTGSSIWVDLVQPAGPDLFIVGHVHGFAREVRLEFPNGDVRRVRPAGELFVIPVPRAHLTTTRQTAIVQSYFNDSIPIKRVGVVFKVRR